MGIAYLGAVAREQGYDVACLDTLLEAPYQRTALTDEICRFGLSYDKIIDRIREWNPDVVGISCLFSNQWPSVRELSKRLKAEDPELIVVIGGAHPTFLSEKCMMDAPVDFIIRGEGERSFIELLDKLRGEQPVDSIDGLAWRAGETIRVNPKESYIENLDSLPFPAHDLFDLERYFKIALPMAYSLMSPRNLPIVTSRGCPCRCTFCSSTNLWGKCYRTRSAENVLAEMDWLVDRFGVKELKFQDDNLTSDRKRAREIFQGMIDRPYYLHWNLPNGIAIWTLDEEMLTLMKRSGCYEMLLAVESGNQEVLTNLIKKPLKLDQIREVNRIARKLGILRGGYFIIGLPGETKSHIMDTIRFSRELKLEGAVIFIYNPLPGSRLFDECVRRGYITEESFFEQGNLYFSSVVDSEEWSSKELETLIRREWRRNYLALMRSPYLLGRRYYKIFRYRPNVLKHIAVRTAQSLKIKGNIGAAPELDSSGRQTL